MTIRLLIEEPTEVNPIMEAVVYRSAAVFAPSDDADGIGCDVMVSLHAIDSCAWSGSTGDVCRSGRLFGASDLRILDAAQARRPSDAWNL